VQATGKAPIVTAAVIRDGDLAHLSAAGHPVDQVGELQFRITAAVTMGAFPVACTWVTS
jgi:hypothetical protein